MTKQRIAYILTPITFGGAEKVSLNFLHYVNRDRFDIRPVLLIRPWEEPPLLAREIERLGYVYHSIPVALHSGGDPLRVLRVVRRIYAILKSGSFDLAHTHGYFADICALPAARILGIKGITTCHGFINNDKKLKFYNNLDGHVIKLCSAIIAVSDSIREGLRHNGISDEKIVVIPNAVAAGQEPCEFNQRRREKRVALGLEANDHVVGYLGRLSEEKGLTYLIDAARQWQAEGLPLKLLIVGDGPSRTTLEEQVRAAGLGSLVIFAGFQPDVEDWLPAFDSFALPSLTEGTPMALLEAMAAGIPVIATAVGGVPQVVKNGVNGLLVPPADSQRFAETVKTLIADKELSRRLVHAGLDTIHQNYDVQSWCLKIETLYDEVIKGGAGAE